MQRKNKCFNLGNRKCSPGKTLELQSSLVQSDNIPIGNISYPGANHNNDYHDNNNSSAINRGWQRHRHNTCTGGKAKEVDLLRGGVASHVGQEQEGGAQRRVDGGGEQVHSQGDDARLPQSHTMLRFIDD